MGIASKKINFYWPVLIRPHLSSFIGLIALSGLVGALGMATVGMGVPLIDTAMGIGQKTSSIAAAVLQALKQLGFALSKSNLILALLVVVSLVGILHSAGMFFQQYWSAFLAQKLRAEIKLALFEKVLKAPYSYLSNKGRGALLYDINNPSQAIYQVVDVFGRMINPFMHIVFYVGLMIFLSPWLTFAMSGLGALWLLWLRKGVLGLSQKYGKQVYEVGRAMGKLDVDALDGIKVVKAQGLEACVFGQQRELLDREWNPKLKLSLLTRGVMLLNEGGSGFVVIALGILVLGLQWISMTFSELIVFMLAVRRLSPTCGSFSSMVVDFNRERKNIEVIDEMIHQTPQEVYQGKSLESISRIELKNIRFCYPSDTNKMVLQNISLEMERGQMTGIVGPTGSGKTTLVHLLLRFFEATGGDILVNGNSLRDLNLKDWRKKIGYVSQDVFLFNESIRDNILLYNPKISQREIEEVSKLAQIHDFIETLPQRYDTVVGDRGLKLSGGQAQRIAMARELLKKPQVFIFDEATSALDNLTEKAVYESILALRQEAIVIVIAHRLSTVQEADQIVVLQEGLIEGLGSHGALLAEAGLYAKLYLAHAQETHG